MKTSPSSLTYLTASLSLSTPTIRSRASVVAYRYVIRSAESGGSVVVKHRRPISTSSTNGRISTDDTTSGSSSTTRRNFSSSSTSRSRFLVTRRGYGRTSSNTFFDPSTPPSPRSRSFHHQALLTPPGSSTSSEPPPQYAKQTFSAESPFSLTPLGSSITPPPSSLVLHAVASGSNHHSTASTQSTSSNQLSHSDKAALFTSGLSTPFPNQTLPAFFGTTLSTARRSNLIFRNGAYGIPKPSLGDADLRRAKGKGKETEESRETIEKEHHLSIGIGEDAYFLRNDSLGVADGVGGWSGHAGANPARWSRKLMHHCAMELARYENVEDELFLQYYEVDPVEILQRAFERSLIECKEEGVIGSSTALLAVLRNDELRLANMGDCCCSIIRGNDYIFRSEEQQHSFNFPVQAGTNSRDTPIKDAQRFNVKVQKDDIVILCSDGLVDNLFDEDILEEVVRFVASTPPPLTTSTNGAASTGARFTLNRFSPQAVSEALCLRAKSVYEDQRAVSSPFQQRAMEEGIHFAGGKRDDVTCVVASIGELEASADRR